MVVDATWWNLVFAPSHTPRWYTPSTLPTVKIPVEQLLHASFSMEAAVAAPGSASSSKQGQAAVKGARVLSDPDHEQAMDSLAQM